MGAGEENVPGVDRPPEGDGEQQDHPPTERLATLTEGEEDGQDEREPRGQEPEAIVARKEPLHQTDGHCAIDQPKRSGGHEEREEDLDAEAGAQNRRGEHVMDPHRASIMGSPGDACQGAGAHD